MSALSPETKALLQRAKAPTPLAPSHKAKIKAAVLANLTATAIAATSTTAAATSVFGTTQTLIAFGVGVGIGVGAIALHEAAAPDASSPVPTVAAIVSSPPRTEPKPVPMRSTGSIPSALVPTPSVRAVDPAIGSRPPRPEASKKVSTAPAPLSSSPQIPPSSVPTAAPSPQLTLQEEVQLIRAADVLIKAGDGNGALGILAEHERRFPNGTLSPERAVQRVLALCAAGRIQEARAQGASLLQSGGPLGARVQASCAGANLPRK